MVGTRDRHRRRFFLGVSSAKRSIASGVTASSESLDLAVSDHCFSTSVADNTAAFFFRNRTSGGRACQSRNRSRKVSGRVSSWSPQGCALSHHSILTQMVGCRPCPTDPPLSKTRTSGRWFARFWREVCRHFSTASDVITLQRTVQGDSEIRQTGPTITCRS